jgi:hypothetical protein
MKKNKDLVVNDLVLVSLIEKYVDRSNAGIVKYGTTLAGNILTFDEWINHLQEELMDATLYLEKIKKLGINNAKNAD